MRLLPRMPETVSVWNELMEGSGRQAGRLGQLEQCSERN